MSTAVVTFMFMFVTFELFILFSVDGCDQRVWKHNNKLGCTLPGSHILETTCPPITLQQDPNNCSVYSADDQCCRHWSTTHDQCQPAPLVTTNCTASPMSIDCSLNNNQPQWGCQAASDPAVMAASETHWYTGTAVM